MLLKSPIRQENAFSRIKDTARYDPKRDYNSYNAYSRTDPLTLPNVVIEGKNGLQDIVQEHKDEFRERTGVNLELDLAREILRDYHDEHRYWQGISIDSPKTDTGMDKKGYTTGMDKYDNKDHPSSYSYMGQPINSMNDNSPYGLKDMGCNNYTQMNNLGQNPLNCSRRPIKMQSLPLMKYKSPTLPLSLN